MNHSLNPNNTGLTPVKAIKYHRRWLNIRVMIKKIVLLFILSSLLISCKQDNSPAESEEKFSVKIGLYSEPRTLFPVKRNGITERQVNQYIFIQGADYDPFSGNNTPVIFEKLPREISVDTGKYKDSYRYDLVIRKEAKWDNGKDITGYDYLFSVKTVLNPLAGIHPAIREAAGIIKGVEVDTLNPKRFSVFTAKNYMNSQELVTNIEIFPEYFYDSLYLLRKIPFKELKNIKKERLLEIKGFEDYMKKINSAYYMRDHVAGAGPYGLESWESNRYIVLKEKNGYWGDKFKDIPSLQSYPHKLIFKIIADKTTAITELKNGNIDILPNVSGDAFKRMRDNPAYKDKFDFYNQLTMRFSILNLNNKNKILKDVLVRKAIAHLIDLDFFLKNYGTGGEKRLTVPVHISKPYYDQSLPLIDFDIDKAKKLLAEAGWKDTDGDGILDKIIDGQRVPLQLTLSFKSGSIFKNLALLIQESAAKAGVKIIPEAVNGKTFRSKIRKRDFDMIPLIIPETFADIDPYWKWHSDNAGTGGSNISGFSDKECDAIIEKIRYTRDKKKRAEYYKQFQRIIYDRQPVVFLYIPTNNIIVNNKFLLRPSMKRPGYFANTVKMKPVK